MSFFPDVDPPLFVVNKTPTNTSTEKFEAVCKKYPDQKPFWVFHGTPHKNVESICKQGLIKTGFANSVFVTTNMLWAYGYSIPREERVRPPKSGEKRSIIAGVMINGKMRESTGLIGADADGYDCENQGRGTIKEIFNTDLFLPIYVVELENI